MAKSYDHGLALYNELLSKAVFTTSDTKYVGSMVDAFRATGISQTYYTPLFRALKELGCIEVLVAARGGGGRQSEILLNFPPDDPDAFADAWHLTKSRGSSIIGQRMNLIERRLPDIDIEAWIVSTELRLDIIEQKLREVQSFGTETPSTT